MVSIYPEYHDGRGNDGCQEHDRDVIMGMVASQITSLTIVDSTVYSDAYQRTH